LSGTSNAPRLSPVGLQNSRLPAHKIFICRDVLQYLQYLRSWGCSIAVSCKSTGNMASYKMKKRGKRDTNPKTERPLISNRWPQPFWPVCFRSSSSCCCRRFSSSFWLLAIFSRYTHLIRGFSFTLSRFFLLAWPSRQPFCRMASVVSVAAPRASVLLYRIYIRNSYKLP